MYKRLNIAICDDERREARLLADMIKSNGLPCEISLFTDGESLLSEPDLSRFDLFFLDIYLEGMTGVELARKLRARNQNCEIVFITISDAHAMEGFAVNALQYLLKPVDAKQVTGLLERFVRIHDRRDLSYCTVVVDRAEVRIFFRDIFYIETFDKYCKLHTREGVVETYSTLSALLEKLPSPPFLRCHRSYVVNMDYVQKAERDFVMKNGHIVYIRQSERASIKETYMKYLVSNARGEMHEAIFD